MISACPTVYILRMALARTTEDQLKTVSEQGNMVLLQKGLQPKEKAHLKVFNFIYIFANSLGTWVF